MPWVVLLVSAVLEAVWATALGRSDGFSDPLATCVFVVALALSMGGLGHAVRTIPIGTGYAVWTGVGAALTVGLVELLRHVRLSLILLFECGACAVPHPNR